jgi:transcriptional regulator with XRE-family HTH domain
MNFERVFCAGMLEPVPQIELEVPIVALSPVIKRLQKWRERNNLSRRQAAVVLQRYSCPVSVSALRGWETGRAAPRELMAKALADVLKAHPVIDDPPKFGRWVKDE